MAALGDVGLHECQQDPRVAGARGVMSATLPRVQPIAPIRNREPFDDPGCLFDLKYDGFRALCDLRPLPLNARRTHLQNILPKGSAVISETLSVTRTGNKLFELMCENDLEGVVAKRLKDGYGSRVRWLKIKNPSYSQNVGRRELFDKPAGAPGHYGLSLQALPRKRRAVSLDAPETVANAHPTTGNLP